MATRQPAEPGEGVEFRIQSETGQTFTLQMAPRQPRGEWAGGRPGGGGPNQGWAAFWTRPPFGFLWLLGIDNMGLTYRYKGRPERPTQNEGEPYKKIIG